MNIPKHPKLPTQSEKLVQKKSAFQSEKKVARMENPQQMFPQSPSNQQAYRSGFAGGHPGYPGYPPHPGVHPGIQPHSQYVGSTRRMQPIKNNSIIESDEGEEEDSELLERAEL
jgi:hypothetical protein